MQWGRLYFSVDYLVMLKASMLRGLSEMHGVTMLETLGKGYGMSPAFLVDDSALLQNFAQHSHKMREMVYRTLWTIYTIEKKGI